MFNYFLSWKQAAKGRSEQKYSSTSSISISISVDDVDAIDVWHLLSLSFLLATCAEVSSSLGSFSTLHAHYLQFH